VLAAKDELYEPEVGKQIDPECRYHHAVLLEIAIVTNFHVISSSHDDQSEVEEQGS